MLEYIDLVKAWVFCLGVAVLHTAILAFNVGRLRGVHKSFATEEDKARAGGTGTVGDVPEVQRANNAHRNQLENLPLFIGASLLFVVVAVQAYIKSVIDGSPTDRDFLGGIILFAVWVFTRIGHSFAYLNQLQPWRSICFGTSATTIFVIVFYSIINVFANTINDH